MTFKRNITYLAVCFAVTCLGWMLPVDGQPVRVACVGNSVTAGAKLNDPAKESYPAQLQTLLGDSFEVKNFGHSGATLLRRGHKPYFKTSEFKALIKYRPQIAIIHLGLNDTDPRNWPDHRDEFVADYSWLIDTIRQSMPQVKIFICTLTPIFSGHPRFLSGTRDWYWEIQKLTPGIAGANHVDIIDLHKPLYPRPDLFPDNLHPDKRGAAILAETVWKKITGRYGPLRVDNIFSSHMVLQRSVAVKFSGDAAAMKPVKATFAGETRTTTAGKDGRWEIVFASRPAGGPYRAVFESDGHSVTLSDILMGDIWICAGQSNMYFPLRDDAHAETAFAFAQSAGNKLRLFNLQPVIEPGDFSWDSTALKKVNELQYFSGEWQTCDKLSAANFSAVGFYFGQKISDSLKVPVGLIQMAVGGSPIESWIDRKTMEFDDLAVNELNQWRTSDFLMPWVRERASENLANSQNPLQRHPFQPCYNFEAGVSNFSGLAVSGVVWYQGESNAHNAESYDHLFPLLVKSWRQHFGRQLPFYYAQLSSINRPSWPYFRHIQSTFEKTISNTGMAVTSDVGDPQNVHPRDKQTVGYRLAGLALHDHYRFRKIVARGPVPQDIIQVKNEVTISFEHSAGLKTADGKAVRGFAVQTGKGAWYNVAALISGNKIILHVGEDASKIFYAWKPFTDANLQNGAGLPAGTFFLDIPKN